MKRLIGLWLALFSLSCFGQNSVSFDSYSYNFGTIDETHGVVEHTFKYVNNSSEPFVIISVVTSCGCTTPSYSREPLPAGQSANITIRFDPADRPGRFNKTIQISSNMGVVELTISGLVNPRPRTVKDDFPYTVGSQIRAANLLLRVEPAPRGRTTTRTVAIINDSYMGAPISVDTTLLPKWLSVKVKNDFIAPGQRSEIELYIKGGELWGMQSTSIPIIVNGHSQAEKLWVTAIFTEDFSRLRADELRNAPRAEFSSYFYHFSTQKSGSLVSYEFKIRNSGGRPLNIGYIESSSKNVTWKIERTTIAPASIATLKVTLYIADKELISESIRVICSDPASPIREIRLMATGI